MESLRCLFLLLVAGCIKFVYMKLGLLLLIANMGLGFRDMKYIWLKVNSICADYTRLFGEMDDLRKEVSSLADTVKSVEQMMDIKLAILIDTCEIASVDPQKALQNLLGLASDPSSDILRSQKARIEKVSNKTWKLIYDYAGIRDELFKLPPSIEIMVYKVTVKPVLSSNIDDLSEAFSSWEEAQLSLERKQDAVNDKVFELRCFVDEAAFENDG